jgi:chemotaxis protein MotB
MARKKKHEEHENLERWLVSYADFMTLLFATFVVLYALSQINVNEFKKVEESLKKAFSINSILDAGSGVFSGEGESVMDSSPVADSMIDTLMMEYISPRYEQESYEQIKKEIEDKVKSGELKDIDAKIDERGLVITLTDNGILFKSGSAELSDAAKKKLEIVGKLVVEKFAMHSIRVIGHTDSIPVSGHYPSNWELSSARASSVVRYLIDRFKILPDLFSAVGYSDTRPVDKANAAKNRRVEIVVQKNQHKNLDEYQNTYMKMDKSEQQRQRNEQMKIVKEIDDKEIIESLGEDVKHSSGLSKKPAVHTEKETPEFLKESQRLNELSNHK